MVGWGGRREGGGTVTPRLTHYHSLTHTLALGLTPSPTHVLSHLRTLRTPYMHSVTHSLFRPPLYHTHSLAYYLTRLLKPGTLLTTPRLAPPRLTHLLTHLVRVPPPPSSTHCPTHAPSHSRTPTCALTHALAHSHTPTYSLTHSRTHTRNHLPHLTSPHLPTYSRSPPGWLSHPFT